jgi:hypothetical protein
VTRAVRNPHAKALQGHRAGFVSRIVADAVDLGVIWALGLSALLSAGVVRYLLSGPPFRIPAGPRASRWPGFGCWTTPAVGFLYAERC